MTAALYDLQQLKTKFDLDGYVVIRGFLSPPELAGLNQELERYIAERVPTLPRGDVYYENPDDPTTLKQMGQINQHDAYFASLAASPKWTGLAEGLLADKVIATELQWFNKPPGRGKATPAHQDGYYFMLEPNEALTMWLALDTVDESNGCVRYIPGSRREGLRPHGRSDVLGFSQTIIDYGVADRNAETPIAAEPGDLLVHHSLTIHRADGNFSERHRRSLGLVYYLARAHRDEERYTAYQRQLKAELQTAKKI